MEPVRIVSGTARAARPLRRRHRPDHPDRVAQAGRAHRLRAGPVRGVARRPLLRAQRRALRRRPHPRGRAQLRHRLVPRARRVGDHGLRLPGRDLAPLRRHLPQQLHQERPRAGDRVAPRSAASCSTPSRPTRRSRSPSTSSGARSRRRRSASRSEFPLDDATRERFLEGLDDIGITLRSADAIDDLRACTERPAWQTEAAHGRTSMERAARSCVRPGMRLRLLTAAALVATAAVVATSCTSSGSGSDPTGDADAGADPVARSRRPTPGRSRCSPRRTTATRCSNGCGPRSRDHVGPVRAARLRPASDGLGGPHQRELRAPRRRRRRRVGAEAGVRPRPLHHQRAGGRDRRGRHRRDRRPAHPRPGRCATRLRRHRRADAQARRRRPEGRQDLDQAEMFLDGDRVMVVQTGWRYDPASLSTRRDRWIDDFSIEGPVRGITRVSVVDLSDPDDLTVTDAFTDRRRLPERPDDRRRRPHRRRLGARRARLPRTAVRTRREGGPRVQPHRRRRVHHRRLAALDPPRRGGHAVHPDCDGVYLPKRFAGAGMVNVLTVPLADRLEPETVSVQGSSQVVYASGDRTCTSPRRRGSTRRRTPTTTLLADPPPTTTDVHRFSLADPKVATYEVSGRVDGTVMGQFALSEHDDFLRVATTDGPQWSLGWPVGQQHHRAPRTGRPAGPAGQGRRHGPGRADHLGPLRRRPGVRRDLPPDRPLLRGRPVRPGAPRGGR